MTAVGDHYRPTGDALDPGVYRVVGTAEEVVLLRVGDADGRRVHTGEVSRVDPATLDAEFESAPDPDAGVGPVSAVKNALQGLYWSVRGLL